MGRASVSAVCNLTQHRWVVILSANRIGSSTIMNMLRQLPGTAISSDRAGMMKSFRDLSDRLTQAEQYALKGTHNSPNSTTADRVWTDQAPTSRMELFCLMQSWFLRTAPGTPDASQIHGVVEWTHTSLSHLDFIAEAFPDAQYIVNYRQDGTGTEGAGPLSNTRASMQLEAMRNLSHWAAAHSPRVFKLPSQDLTSAGFTKLAAWLGKPGCSATRTIRFASSTRNPWVCQNDSGASAGSVRSTAEYWAWVRERSAMSPRRRARRGRQGGARQIPRQQGAHTTP